MTIPVIGTAVVANTKWVRRLIESVDYPVKEFLIINNNGRGEIDHELDEMKALNQSFIGKIRVLHMPSNIGVPASWNFIIKSYMMAPFWIIVNDDVAFCPGFLREMMETEEREKTAGMIHGFAGDFGVGSWDLFLIRDSVIVELGLFDENLYPAYGEDADYFMRIIGKNVRRIMSLRSNYLHGDGFKDQYHTHGSQTAKSSPELRDKLNCVNIINFEYMTEKWGPGWRTCSPTQLPFQGQSHSIGATKFDLNFARKKHLGF